MEQYVRPAAVIRCHHGVDTRALQPRKPKRRSDRLRCLSVGKWLRDYEVILETARLLQDESVEFHIVNPDVSRDEQIGVFAYCRIDDKELLDLYQRCDLLFLPLKDATANNVILEAMACGMAVLSTDLPSLREYTSPEGSILMSSDAMAYADVIRSLANDREKVEKMGIASHERAQELSWGVVVEQLIRLYRSG